MLLGGKIYAAMRLDDRVVDGVQSRLQLRPGVRA